MPDVADAPHEVLPNILKGRIEDLHGWALFNQEKYPEAITHLKQASQILPAQTPAWRTALWHLGAALEQIRTEGTGTRGLYQELSRRAC